MSCKEVGANQNSHRPSDLQIAVYSLLFSIIALIIAVIVMYTLPIPPWWPAVILQIILILIAIIMITLFKLKDGFLFSLLFGIFIIATIFNILIMSYFRSNKPISISGIILSTQGQPLSNLEITLRDSSGKVIGPIITDNDGKFLIESFSPGLFQIYVGTELIYSGDTRSIITSFYSITIPDISIQSISYRFSPTVTKQIFPTNTPTSTPTVEPTIVPLPIVKIDSGEFTMGSSIGLLEHPASPPHYSPQHMIYLDTYLIDIYEVTNEFYSKCIIDGKCTKPAGSYNFMPNDWSKNPLPYANYPVVNVTWYQAHTYCEWNGGRLPTEAEWEKAARWDPSTNTARTFPWGEDNPTQQYANYKSGGTIQVGALPSGASYYGLYDSAGNVLEWVSDWYLSNYYSKSPYRNPLGPLNGANKVVKGGAWPTSVYTDLWTFARYYYSPISVVNFIGFRCAYNDK